MRILSLLAGQVENFVAEDARHAANRPWQSAIRKTPVEGPRRVHALGLEGDAQADRVHHGGPDKALLAYAAAHYEAWAEEWGAAPEHGAFGENLTLDGAAEADVCIGDVYQIGGGPLRVQVSQPRQPCWKLARRWNRPALPKRVQETGRTGWYLRVLTPGIAEAGAALALTNRPCPRWSIARANAVMHGRGVSTDEIAALAALPELAQSWRETLARRLERGAPPDARARLEGTDGG